MVELRRYELVKISKLKPYKRNARKHSQQQLEQIANSIREFGFVNPVLVDSDFNVIAGHGRILAAQDVGMTELPCIFVEDLTDEQRRAYILADNRLTELGGWDDKILQLELADLGDMGFDISLTGFGTPDFEPVDQSEQPRLDEKKLITCPHCGEEF